MSASDPSQSPITQLLVDMADGSTDASNRLFELLYDELRQLARVRVGKLAKNQTIQPTALVHEAWVRLGHDISNRWESRAHFFGAAARAMRNILVDQHRHKRRAKRGGDKVHVEPPSQVAIPDGLPAIDLIALDEALSRFEAAHARPAQIVMLRYFAGASTAETARMLDVSSSTVERDWLFARTWLRRELS